MERKEVHKKLCPYRKRRRETLAGCGQRATAKALLAPLGRDTEVAALPQGLRDVDDGQVSDSGRTVCIVDDL